MADWYRKASWSASDERDFRARLARSRKRGEYLRIQAIELLQHGLAQPALQLFDELLNTEPDHLQLAWTHESRAQAFIEIGQPLAALEALRTAMAIQRRRPNVRGYAALAFAELVLSLKRSDLYAEAIAVLDELHDRGPFPSIHYRESAVRALVAEHFGDLPEARRFAREALNAAATGKAPFARHPDIGFVKGVDAQVYAHLESLGAA